MLQDPSQYTENRNGSFAIIPSFVLDNENLDEGAKSLYARISMYSQDGRCWASNAHFAEKQKVDIRTIQRWLKQLIENDYIEVELEKGGFQTKRNIWILIDFKKNFTKRHTCHPDATYMSPPGETYVTHTMYKQDKEDIDKDNVLEPPEIPKLKPKEPEKPKIKKDNEKTMTRSKDQDKTLDAKRRWKLTQEEYEHFLYMKDQGVDSDDGTIAYWCKIYSFQRIYDVLQAAKNKGATNIGAYMNKLFKTDAIVQNSQLNANKQFAEDYKKQFGWHQLKICEKYCYFEFGRDKVEIPFNLNVEDFMNRLIDKHEVFRGENG